MVIVGISATGWQLLAGNVSAHAIVIRLLVKSQAQQLSVQRQPIKAPAQVAAHKQEYKKANWEANVRRGHANRMKVATATQLLTSCQSKTFSLPNRHKK